MRGDDDFSHFSRMKYSGAVEMPPARAAAAAAHGPSAILPMGEHAIKQAARTDTPSARAVPTFTTR